MKKLVSLVARRFFLFFFFFFFPNFTRTLSYAMLDKTMIGSIDGAHRMGFVFFSWFPALWSTSK